LKKKESAIQQKVNIKKKKGKKTKYIYSPGGGRQNIPKNVLQGEGEKNEIRLCRRSQKKEGEKKEKRIEIEESAQK